MNNKFTFIQREYLVEVYINNKGKTLTHIMNIYNDSDNVMTLSPIKISTLQSIIAEYTKWLLKRD